MFKKIILGILCDHVERIYLIAQRLFVDKIAVFNIIWGPWSFRDAQFIVSLKYDIMSVVRISIR